MLEFRCPTCQRIAHVARREDLPTRPFCSDRCQQVDLYKWLNEEYQLSEPLPPDFEPPPSSFPPE